MCQYIGNVEREGERERGEGERGMMSKAQPINVVTRYNLDKNMLIICK